MYRSLIACAIRSVSGLLCALAGSTFAQTPAGTVSVCADPDPPPWTYWVRDATGQKTTTYTGSSVETFRAAFRRLDRNVQFIGDLPWARCLAMVRAGQVDFAMDAYFDAERAKVFAYSRSYSTLTPQVFFRAEQPLAVAVVADLKRYRGCGMIGASYLHYGLQPSELDLGVNTYEAMIAKLKAGRCDYFVEELEVISGYKRLGRDFLSDGKLAWRPVTDAAAPAKHLIAARDSAAAALLPRLNEVLDAMQRSGELAAIWKRHAPDLAYKP